MKGIRVEVYEIAKDGLPPKSQHGGMEDEYVGRVAFLWDGNVVNGWPITGHPPDEWEANSDVGRGGIFKGVTHWLYFPVELWNIEKGGGAT